MKLWSNLSRTIEIKPGYTCGQVLTLEHEGNEVAGINPCKKLLIEIFKIFNFFQKQNANFSANLIITLKQKKHEFFKRKGNDLIYTSHISLIQALCSSPVSIVSKFIQSKISKKNSSISNSYFNRTLWTPEAFPSP